jgi:HK97 family phage major capsid protein
VTDLTEIKGLVEAINEPLTQLRSEVDGLKEHQKDVLTQEKMDRMSADIIQRVDALQAKQSKMEAALNRPATGGNGMGDEVEAKHRAAFRAYVTGGDMPAGFKADSYGVEVKAMSTDVNPDGGYLVRPELSATVIDRVFDTSPIRQVANVETIGGKAMDVLIDTDEAAAEWEGEGSTATATTTPQVGRKTIAAHILLNKLTLTSSMIEDGYLDVEAWLGRKSADRFARKENAAFVNGTGVGQPRGFLTYAAWASAGTYEDNKIEQVACGASSAVTAAKIIDLQYSLKEAYQANATWGMKRATFGAVMQLKGADQFHFGPVLLRDGQAQMQLLGRPVVFMDDMPAQGANALCMVYADFSRAYTIVDRVGLQFLRDPYSAKPNVEIQARKRTGGDVTSYDAIKIGKTPS